MDAHSPAARRHALRAAVGVLALGCTAVDPAQAADPLCVDATHAARLYDDGWQAYARGDWISAYGTLEFYYLLTVNTGELQRDQSFMQELIAAKNHARGQLAAMRNENEDLRSQLARQAQPSSGDIRSKYQGVRQGSQAQAPALRRSLPPGLR